MLDLNLTTPINVAKIYQELMKMLSTFNEKSKNALG